MEDGECIVNARLYVRVSRDEQVKFGYSIDAQLDALKTYCKDNKIKIADTYVDEGISAATINKRHEFVRMINECENGDIILFTKLDRFSRNLLDANMIVSDLDKKNIAIKAINEDDIDTTTADGKFIFNLKLSLAQREREKTSERINDVFEYKARNGQIISGTIPFGYKIVDKKYVRDDAKANALLDAYNMVYTFKSASRANQMFNEKYPEYKMKYGNFINRLKNKINIGVHKYNDEFCEGIIPIELFDSIQEILDNNNIRTRRIKSIFLFSGLVVCATCGRKMVGNRATRKNSKINPNWKDTYCYVYRCNRAFIDKMCTNRHILSENKVEKYLLDNLGMLLYEYMIDVETRQKKQKDHTKDIANIKKKMNKLKDLYLDELIQRDEYEISYKDLESKLNEYSKIKPIQVPVAIKQLIGINIKEHYTTLDRTQKQALWQSIIKRIEFKEDMSFSIYFI